MCCSFSFFSTNVRPLKNLPMAYVAIHPHNQPTERIRKVGHFPQARTAEGTSSTLERKKNKTEEAEAKKKMMAPKTGASRIVSPIHTTTVKSSLRKP